MLTCEFFYVGFKCTETTLVLTEGWNLDIQPINPVSVLEWIARTYRQLPWYLRHSYGPSKLGYVGPHPARWFSEDALWWMLYHRQQLQLWAQSRGHSNVEAGETTLTVITGKPAWGKTAVEKFGQRALTLNSSFSTVASSFASFFLRHSTTALESSVGQFNVVATSFMFCKDRSNGIKPHGLDAAPLCEIARWKRPLLSFDNVSIWTAAPLSKLCEILLQL